MGLFPDPLEMPGQPSSRKLVGRLYHGETRYDFVGRAKLWFAISGTIILIGLVALVGRGLNLGIDFEGGVVWELPIGDTSVEEVRDELLDAGLADAKVQSLESDEGVRLRVQNESLGLEQEQQIANELADLAGVDPTEVSLTSVGPSWGDEVSRKAFRALVFFLIAITIYVTLRFEFKMALATLAALFHDILVTVGVYAIFQFPVTPATVIAFLTILGFSLYDTVVVFDKIRDNEPQVGTVKDLTYTDMANRSLNEVLMRSLNTSFVALLPVASLLVVGVWVYGALALRDFGLALFVGLLTGAYSSIFVATPLLAWLKEREPRHRAVAERAEVRAARGSGAVPTPEPVPVGGAPGAPEEAEANGSRRATAAKAPRPSPAPAAERPADAPVITPRPRQQRGRKRK
jgi:preprotein translocase subunit SecF